jgi:ribosomal protein S8
MRTTKKFYLDRLKAVYDYFKANPGAHRNSLVQALTQYPMGTLSSDLSLMTKTGYLKQVSSGCYSVPALSHCNPEEIAVAIKRVHRQKQPVDNLTIFDKSTIDNLAVEQAIALVKKNGYRVYKSVTKLEEV